MVPPVNKTDELSLANRQNRFIQQNQNFGFAQVQILLEKCQEICDGQRLHFLWSTISLKRFIINILKLSPSSKLQPHGQNCNLS